MLQSMVVRRCPLFPLLKVGRGLILEYWRRECSRLVYVQLSFFLRSKPSMCCAAPRELWRYLRLLTVTE